MSTVDGHTPYEQLLNELRVAVPGLHAIADHVCAVAAATAEEGPHRRIEGVGLSAADLILAISRLFQSF